MMFRRPARAAFASICFCLLLAACQYPAVSTSPSPFGSTAQPTATQSLPSLTPTQTASATPAPTASPTPIPPCLDTQGAVERFEIDSPALGEPLAFRVYTPPCYGHPDASGKMPRYPVLYMLHGQTSTDEQWQTLGLTTAADRLITSGELAPFLIVLPFERRNLEHPFTTGFEQAIPDELVPWIDAQYNTCPERACRAIGGLSRGAAWAVRLGLTRWQLFSSIGAHSVPPFTGDPGHLPAWLADIPASQLPRIWIDIGRSDPYLQSAEELEALLTQLDVPHEWHLNDGNHNADYWSAHVEEYLRWYWGAP